MSETVESHLCGWMVLRRSDDRLLLARRDGVRYGNGLWGLPGGHAARHETWRDAAIRETHEEVGVRVDPGDAVPLGVQRYVDGSVAGVDAFFTASSWQGEPRPVSECSQVAWFDPTQLPHDALPWLERTLQTLVLHGIWLDEVL